MMRTSLALIALAAALSGCAGRAPSPVAIVQDRDQAADCASLQRETVANVGAMERLRKERENKIIQNGAAIGAGIFIWPILFATDFQGAASTDLAALEQRQHHLGRLAAERCAIKAATAE